MRYYISSPIVALLTLHLSILSFAQSGEGKDIPNSQLILSGYGGFTFNNMNVRNNDIYPNPLKAPSTFTFNPKVTLDFQRTTRYRMVYGIGIEYGTERQHFDLAYPSFDYVDTTFALKNSSAYARYRNKANYLGLRLTIGYLYLVKVRNQQTFNLETKLTITKRFMEDGGEVSYRLVADYISGDTLYSRRYDVTRLFGLWGNRNVPNSGLLFTELNVGARKHINWLRNDIYFGIYSSWKSFFFRSNEAYADVEITNGHYLNGQLQYYDTDYYTGMDFVLGVRLGIGLRL